MSKEADELFEKLEELLEEKGLGEKIKEAIGASVLRIDGTKGYFEVEKEAGIPRLDLIVKMAEIASEMHENKPPFAIVNNDPEDGENEVDLERLCILIRPIGEAMILGSGMAAGASAAYLVAVFERIGAAGRILREAEILRDIGDDIDGPMALEAAERLLLIAEDMEADDDDPRFTAMIAEDMGRDTPVNGDPEIIKTYIKNHAERRAKK